MMGIYPSSLPSLLRTPSLNLLPPTLLQLVIPDTDTPATSENPYSAHLPQCFVPISIYDRAGDSALVCSGVTIKPIHVIIICHHDVASIGGVPINEFTTEGYFSHFPHSSLPVREISQGNARIRLPLATTSSI